jgi:carbamoyltransferase
MKDKLNAGVKFREWFRPFAPVVQEKDAETYFDGSGLSPFMSFAAKVKPEWKDIIPAIVHVDGTARVQTVNKQQHEWLYTLLDEYKALSGKGVLLNTSFNTKGKPLLNSAAEALDILKNTQLDAVVIEDQLFLK